MGYQKIAFKSAGWVSMLRGFLRISGLIRTAILARILTPTQFGLFGIAAIVLGFLEMLTETGINVFLIQQTEKEAVKKYLNTAWAVSILRGIFISSLLVIATPIIVGFFEQPNVAGLLYLTATIPLVRGFINPAIANFQKQLRFKQEFWFRSSIIATESIVAIAISYLYQSPVGLVLGLLASAVVEVILSFTVVKPRPGFHFDLTQFKDIIHRGKWITLAGIMNYFSDKISDVATGKLLNTQSLGFYQMAYRFGLIPTEEVIEIISKVSFPIYVKIAGDRSRLKRAYIKTQATFLTYAIPAAIILTVFPRQFILVALGEQWIQAATLMPAMAGIIILMILNAPSNPLFLAVQKQNYLTLITLIRLITISIVILPLVARFQLLGVVYALGASYLTPLPFRFFLTAKILSSNDAQVN